MYGRIVSGSPARPPDQATQRLLWLHYQELIAAGRALPSFDVAGFRAYSENEEDGIILLIFAVVGTTNRTCVDIAFSAAEGANTTNLIANWGWSGLLVEADAAQAKAARSYFRRHRDTVGWQPTVVEKWVTAENVNDVFADSGITFDIDFLSLDLDGIDYWVWKSLSIVRPRLVLIEAQLSWGPGESVTVPYNSSFASERAGDNSYTGASLAAFVKLARSKGYHLIGSNRYGYNAFFLRDDLATESLPEVTSAECLRHPRAIEAERRRRGGGDSKPWIEV